MLRSFLVLMRHADLVVDHLFGYAGLAKAEISTSFGAWMSRVAAFACTAVFGLCALVSGAVILALCMAGTIPATLYTWSVPLVCALLALACGVYAAFRPAPSFSGEIESQLRKDATFLRTYFSSRQGE